MYLRFGKFSNKLFVMGVLSRIINNASNSSKATIASFSSLKASLKILKSNLFL